MRACGSALPHGYLRVRPVAGSNRAAFSHSASVGGPGGPASVRVGLVPAHVQHGLVRRDGLRPAEDPAGPLRAVPPPVKRRGQPGLLPVLPADRGPPARVVVSAVLDELDIGAAGHRGGVEIEGGHVDGMGGPLVVQRPRFGGGAHRERAAADEYLGRQPGRVGRRRPGGGGGEHRSPGPDLMGDQHRLVVLYLVLGDIPNANPSPCSRVPVNAARSSRSSTRPRTSCP